MNGERDIVIVDGARTPFVKSGTELARVSAVDLGRIAMREAIERAEIDPAWIDEVIVGNIAGPPDSRQHRARHRAERQGAQARARVHREPQLRLGARGRRRGGVSHPFR